MELAFSMPGDLKIRDGERKWILKRAMRGILPERILTRRKEGFSIPMKNWLRRELQPMMRDAAVAGADGAAGAVRPDGSDASGRQPHGAAAKTTPTRCSR